MTPSITSACLLLLLCLPLVSCGRIPSSLQGDRGDREQHPHPGLTVRKPKENSRKLTSVLDVSDDVDHEPDTEGEYTGVSLTKPGMSTDFTICGALRTEAWTGLETGAELFQLNGEDGQQWGYVSVYAASTYTEYEVSLGHVWLSVTTASIWFPLTWTRVCVSLDTVSGTVVVDTNGQVGEEKVHQEALEDDGNRPLVLNITVGYSVDAWRYVQEFSGQYSHLNVFSSPLSTARMVAMTSADSEECGAPGDFLRWEQDQFQIHSLARMVTVDELEGPCRRESGMNVFTAVFGLHSECMHHCEKLGKGRSPPVRTLEELETLQTEVAAITPNIAVLPWLWLSATDQEEEGDWRDYYTGERLGDYVKPWYPGHDNKFGDRYNCLIMYPDTPPNIAWGEWQCSSSDKGCPCQYTQQPVLLLRGLCQKSVFDRRFTPKQLASSPRDVFLVGGVSTQIRFMDSSEQWVMTDAVYSVKAECRATKVSYVLGKHEWTVTDDVFSCSKGQPYTTLLKLSGCNPDGEFTCNNGQCVTMEQRCNQIANCRDESDEVDCKLLLLKNNYNKKIPPIVSTGGDEFNPTHVAISISLLKIVSMEEVQHKIDFQFQIILEWKENRVTYHNLKIKTSLNALSDTEVRALWLPYLIYSNTDMKEAVQLDDGVPPTTTTIVVTREGNFTRSGLEVTDETEIFEGKHNRLSMYQTYTKSFQCQYHLHRYPFDTQV